METVITNTIPCPIWGTPATHRLTDGDYYDIRSPRAGGRYQICGTTVRTVEYLDDKQKALLTSWLIEQRETVERPLVKTSTVGKAKKRAALTEVERANRLLVYIKQSVPSIGAPFPYSIIEGPALWWMLAWTESISSNETSFLLRHLEDEGYLKKGIATSKATQYELTLSGHTRAASLTLQSSGDRRPLEGRPATNGWDVFVCHASEDKDEVATPLAEALQARGFKVWYDDFELKIGDSLHQVIDRGLAKSRYGVVILSPSFLEGKKWTEVELGGLLAREDHGSKVILPVWFDITAEKLRNHSPTLADRYAAQWNTGVEQVADDLMQAMGRVGEGADPMTDVSG